MYQLARFSFGNARSFAPIMIGTRKLPSTAGIDGNQEEEHHHHAVHREQLVVGLVGHQIAGRRRQLEPDQHRERAADEKEERDRREVQQRDALVIAGQQPRRDAVAVVQVVLRRHAERSLRHDYLVLHLGERAVSDLMYSISCSSCSSVTRPWNVGMIG